MIFDRGYFPCVPGWVVVGLGSEGSRRLGRPWIPLLGRSPLEPLDPRQGACLSTLGAMTSCVINEPCFRMRVAVTQEGLEGEREFRNDGGGKSSWRRRQSSWNRTLVQLRLTLCDPVDCSTPGFPAHHQLPELAQTHVCYESVMPSNHLVLCRPLLLLTSVFPSIRVYQEQDVAEQ